MAALRQRIPMMILVAALLWMALAEMAAAQVLATDRETYVIGAPLTLSYRRSMAEGEPTPSLQLYRRGQDDSISFPAPPLSEPEGVLKLAAPADPGVYEVRMLGRESAVLARTGFEAIVTPTPGALGLGKTRFVVGEELPVTVTLTPDRFYGNSWVGLFRAGTRAQGGASIDDERLTWQRTPAEGETLTFAAPAGPGNYALRLFDRDAHYYILDSIEFEVDVPALPGALALEKEVFTVGETIKLTVDLPQGRHYGFGWVGLFSSDSEVEGGAGHTGERLTYQRFPEEGNVLTFAAPTSPGEYEFRVYDRDDWHYLLDTIAFRIEVPPLPDALALEKDLFTVGEAIQLTVDLPEGRHYGFGWVGLFSSDREVEGGAGRTGERLTYQRFPDEGNVLTFTAPASPGDYEFRIYDRDDWGYLLDTIAFRVEVPPLPDALTLDKEFYRVGEPIRVTVSLPQGRHYGFGWVGLFRSDVEAEGGSIVTGERLTNQRFPEEGNVLTFAAPASPGDYEFRVYDRDAWGYLLDTISFQVDVPPSDLLSVQKRDYAPGELIRVVATLPTGQHTGQAWVGLFGSGHAVKGGALVGEWRAHAFSIDEPRKRLAFDAPKTPGPYVLRLYDRNAGHYILAAVELTVRGDSGAGAGRVTHFTPLPGQGEAPPPRPRPEDVEPAVGPQPAPQPVADDPQPDRPDDPMNDPLGEPPLDVADNRDPADQDAEAPAPEGQPTLRFIGLGGAGLATLSELAAGQPFMVEARFSDERDENSFTVDLAAGDGSSRGVTVTRTDEANVYRSGVIRIGEN